jgi:SNF2 family DNA or RNA helicase
LIYSAAHNALAVETDAALQTLALVGGGTRVNGFGVACPATLANLQALRRGGHICPPPMDIHGYDWPIKRGWKVMPHQRVTANFLALHPRSFCLNDMGSMKTLSALWAADYLMEMHRRQGVKMRALVVAPLSILSTTWGEAIWQHFIGRRTFTVLTGTAEKRRKLLEKDTDFYIINHDGLAIGVPATRKSPLEGLAKDLSLRDDIRLAIIDEASAYRNATTRRHRAARALLKDRPYLWLMTGTPTPNGPTDAYGMAKLVNDAYGETFTNYKARVMLNVSQYKWVAKSGSAQEAKKLLTPAVRFAIEDCIELPPCTVQQREVPLSAAQTRAYHVLKNEAVLAMQSGQLVHAVNEAALRMKLIQVACGAIYDVDHKTVHVDPGPRLAELESIIEDTERKVVVAAPLTNVLEMLHGHFKDKYVCAVINGQVKGKERDDLIRRMGDHNDPLKLIFVDPTTVSHGVNQFVTANVAIWYGPTDKNEAYQQLNKRIDRPGQTVPTTIIQLVATKIEKEIFARLEANQSMQGVILKLAEGLL